MSLASRLLELSGVAMASSLMPLPFTLAIDWGQIGTGLLFVSFLFISVIMVLIVLIQKPQGGGLSGAFGAGGGGSGQTAFGARTGDALTIATIIVFVFFLVISVALNLNVNPSNRPIPTIGPVGAETVGDEQTTPPPANGAGAASATTTETPAAATTQTPPAADTPPATPRLRARAGTQADEPESDRPPPTTAEPRTSHTTAQVSATNHGEASALSLWTPPIPVPHPAS